MARALKVNREKALESAMLVFWSQGFTATSVDDLQRAMGIQRGSFYFQFKDKRSLFFEVLDFYKENVVEKRRQMVRDQKSPVEGIRFFFEKIVDHLVKSPKNAGCLNTNTSAEMGARDREVSERLRSSMLEWTAFWTEIVELGKARGQIAKSIDSKSVAQGLVALTQGLNVLGKVNPERKFLSETMNLALEKLLAIAA